VTVTFQPRNIPARESEPPGSGSLEGRASFALKVLAAIHLAGIVLALFPPITPVAILHTLAFNAAAAALAGLLILEARGLDRHRAWAVGTIRPLLVVIGLAGTYWMVVAFGEGRIRLPFDVALAIWAGLGPTDWPPIPRPGGRSISLVVAVVLLVASMLLGGELFAWGGLLDVDEPDIQASITADCGPGTGNLPDAITIRFDWSWTRSSPIPSGLDIVVIGWTGGDALGRPLYLFDDDPESGKGIYSGRRLYPSIDMATQVARRSKGSWQWGVELAERGFEPGHIELLLRRAREAPPEPEPLSITASYVHLGVWHHDTATITCSW
jgi:hypothetical protein